MFHSNPVAFRGPLPYGVTDLWGGHLSPSVASRYQDFGSVLHSEQSDNTKSSDEGAQNSPSGT